MKILLLADEESKYYWDYFEKSKLEGIDLIISCGDLAPQFLSFMATFAKVPILCMAIMMPAMTRRHRMAASVSMMMYMCMRVFGSRDLVEVCAIISGCISSPRMK